jgi:hypothetical protein
MDMLRAAGTWEEEWRSRLLYTGTAELSLVNGLGRVRYYLDGRRMQCWGPADILQSIFGEGNTTGEFNFIVDNDPQGRLEVVAIAIQGRPRERCVVFPNAELAAA